MVTPKTTDRTILFLKKRIRFNLLHVACRFNEGDIKYKSLFIIISEKHIVSARHPRS